MVLDLRDNNTPNGIIILWSDTGTLPTGFSHVCALFNKFPKQVPTACTNPGTCRGTDCHAETCGGACHSHTSGAVAHTHVLNHGNAASPGGDGPFTDTGGQAPVAHKHVSASTSVATTMAVANGTMAHTHATTSVLPPFITTRYIKKSATAIVTHRGKQLPVAAIIMWNDLRSLIPSEYSQHTAYDGCYLRGVANACVAPGSTGGTTTHQHAGDATLHCHTQTFSTHDHNWASFAPFNAGSSSSTFANLSGSHSHPLGSLGVGPETGAPSPPTTCANGHQHATSNNDPQHNETLYMKHNIICMRREGVPKDGIVLWDDVLANIPPGYLNTDGTSCTPNFLARYAKGVPAATDPSCQGGFTTHTHAVQTHTHNSSPTGHTHPQSGVSGTASNSTISPHGSPPAGFANVAHTHTASANTNSSTFVHNPGSGGSHSHTATASCPATKDYAFIQRKA